MDCEKRENERLKSVLRHEVHFLFLSNLNPFSLSQLIRPKSCLSSFWAIRNLRRERERLTFTFIQNGEFGERRLTDSIIIIPPSIKKRRENDSPSLFCSCV